MHSDEKIYHFSLVGHITVLGLAKFIPVLCSKALLRVIHSFLLNQLIHLAAVMDTDV